MAEGVLELHPKGFGFLRNPLRGYSPLPTDPYVPAQTIQRMNLQEGLLVGGPVEAAPKRGTGPRLLNVDRVEKDTPDKFNIECTSTGGGWSPLKGDNNLYIRWDEQQMTLKAGPVVNLGGRPGDEWEQMTFEISRNDLKNLAEAKKLEIKLGGSSARKWTEDQKKEIQALLTLTTVTTKQ